MSTLALDSLLIEDFRAFKRLEVERLGRVNLIVGKNNTGKTALLEALRLHASKGAARVLAELVIDRDEEAFTAARHQLAQVPRWENVIWALRFGRGPASGVHKGNLWKIGSLYSNNEMFSYLFTGFDKKLDTYKLSLSQGNRVVRIVRLGSTPRDALQRPKRVSEPKSLMIASRGIESDEMGLLWDDVVLSGQDRLALEALRIIGNSIEYFNFVSRVPVVRTSSDEKPVPLRSMGEGMDRLLGFSLGLAITSDGMLMIDEIENGLHYSVQPQVWDLIFTAAAEFNVQVFATTHSLDCIRAFQHAAAQHPEEGVLISLRRREHDLEQIVAVELDESELETAVRSDIEVR